jgi:hypothetical protein
MSSDEEDPGVWAKRIWSSRNGGKTATASSQRSRQRSKGGSGVIGRSSSSSSAFASYTALTASLLAAGGPFTPTPPPAGPSSAATTKTTSTTTSMSLPKMTTKSRSSNNNKCGSKIDDEKENVLPANHTNNPNSCNIKIMTPSKSKLNIDDGENENAPPVIQSPPPYWKGLNERGGKTSPRTTRSASKKALQKTTATTTIDANNNCSFKRRMQDRYELADDNDDDDDDDEGIVATRSCGSGNNNIDPTTLLHFSPHNKQFEIESVRSSKRRRDAELQKEQLRMEKAREQLGACGGGANKQMAKRAKRGRGHPNTAASPQEEENEEAAVAMTQQKMMLDKAMQEGNEWRERARQFEGQCETHKAKCEVLSSELDFTKTEVRRLQDANTKHAVALALLQSQLDQSNAERDSAIERAGLADVAKEEAVKEAVASIMTNANADGQLLSEMKVECNDLKSRLKVQQMIEEEICKLLDVDIASVDFTTTNTRSADSMKVDDGRGAKIWFLDVIKRRLNEYRSYVTMKDDAEKRLQGCLAELEKVKADYQVSVDYSSTMLRRVNNMACLAYHLTS